MRAICLPAAPHVQGFPAARATRALYHSGGESLEAAIGWLEEHQGDADLDEPLLVPEVGPPPACLHPPWPHRQADWAVGPSGLRAL
jgi:hypothetical protein